MANNEILGRLYIPATAAEALTLALEKIQAQVLEHYPELATQMPRLHTNVATIACGGIMAAIAESCHPELVWGIQSYTAAAVIDGILEPGDCCELHYGKNVAQIGNLAIEIGKARRKSDGITVDGAGHG